MNSLTDDTRRTAAATDAPATSRRRSGASLSELITVQWQRERGDLDLQNFLLAIYFMRLGTLVDRAFDRGCQKRYGISGSDMRVGLGDDEVRNFAQEAGIPEDEAADVLAAVVPQVVNGLTPDGRVPSDDELEALLRQLQPA